MSLDEALNPDNLLCYEMNGAPLPPEHGFPVRLIAPGWYGVANVKWLTRIEVMDHRYTGRFMARDYVTIRERAAGRRDRLDVHLREPRPAEVGAGQSHASRRPIRHRGRRLGRSIAAVEVRSTTGLGWLRDSMALRRARSGRMRGYSPGGSGRSTGGSLPRASTRLRRGRSTPTAISNQRRTTLPREQE